MDNTKPIGESKVWPTTCASFIMLKKHIIPKASANWAERMNTPLWALYNLHISPSMASFTQVYQKRLREVGISMLGSILDPNGNLKSWEEVVRGRQVDRCEQAYLKLCGNIDLSKSHVHRVGLDKTSLFLLPLYVKAAWFGNAKLKKGRYELCTMERQY